MPTDEIAELQQVFLSRLDTLSHLLDAGTRHLPDFRAALQQRLAPDMFPLGSQIAITCNQARGFSRWCAGRPIHNLHLEVESLELARSYIRQTKDLVAALSADDSKLDEIKRVGLGPGRFCDLPGRRYVTDYLMPNLYFHISIAYAILRKLGVPLGKADYMSFLVEAQRYGVRIPSD